MGNSVPSTISLVGGNFWLKSVGEKSGPNHRKATNFLLLIGKP